MIRRRFLATAIALLAGCTTNTPITDSPDQNPTTATRTQTNSTTTRTAKRLPEPSISKGEQMVASSVEQLECTRLPTDPVTCPDSPEKLAVTLSTPTTALSGGELDITLTNEAEATFTWNPYDWTLYTRGNGKWRKLAPVMIPAPLEKLPPGESHTYTVTCTNAELLGIFSYRSETQINLYGLGPGPFGFTITGHFGNAPDTDHTAGAIFGFYGDEPPIEPTTHVESTEFDDSTLEVTTADAADTANTYLQLDFTNDTPDQQLLSDHVRQTRGLRNTLSFAPTNGISTIRYYDTEQAIEKTRDYLNAITESDTDRYGFREYTFTLTTTHDS